MKKFALFLSFLGLFSFSVYGNMYSPQCAIERDDTLYPMLNDQQNSFIFKLGQIEEISENIACYHLMLEMNHCFVGSQESLLHNCFDPYTMQIKSAFFVDDGSNRELILILSQLIEVNRRDELYGDTGKTYEVKIFSESDGKFLLDRVKTHYFGSGFDLIDRDTNHLVYGYPYKTKESIQNEMRSDLYQSYLSQSAHAFTVKSKAFLYNAPYPDEKRNQYLVAGDKVSILDVSAGWVKISYQASKQKIIEGWLEREFIAE